MASFDGYDLSGHLSLGARNAAFYNFLSNDVSGTTFLTGSIPIFFKDLHINDGAPTEGSLEVTVSGPDAEIQLDSFTYTSNNPVQRATATVPDQGSSLALLAMGAGGVLAVRRWRTAQGRS